jgi:2-amino-4-hydroxy-6-hydroxymethyldihydropteridine diphosphokinase
VSELYLGAIGGNRPTKGRAPADNLLEALAELRAHRVTPIRVSAIYRTPAFPPGSGPDFANAAFVAQSGLTPHGVLSAFHAVEARFGRERMERWGARTLDIDLIAAGSRILPDAAGWRRWHDLAAQAQRVESPDQLILPHPRMQDRAFVLVPLLDVAPDWRHPVLGRTIAEMCAEIPAADRDSVVKLADAPLL